MFFFPLFFTNFKCAYDLQFDFLRLEVISSNKISVLGVLFLFLIYLLSLWQVINKFYEIRQHLTNGIEDISWEDKCECLLHDSEETWSFNDYPTSRYIVSSGNLGNLHNLQVTDVKTIRSIL